MARRPGPQVQIHGITLRPNKPRPHIVSWKVGGRGTTRAFPTKREATKFRDELVAAEKNGLRFSSESLLPIEWDDAQLKVAEIAYLWFHSRYEDWAPRTRRSASEPTVELMMALLSPRAPHGLKNPDQPDHIRLKEETAIWLSTPKAADSIPTLLDKYSLPLENVTKSQCLDAEAQVMTRHSGDPKAPATQQRYRATINALFNWAVEHDYISTNPWPRTKRSTKKSRRTKTRVQSGAQPNARLNQPSAGEVVQILDAIAGPNSRPGARSRRMIFELMFYAGLRPSEAVALRIENCELPEDGWGLASINLARTSSTSRWTKAGEEIGETKTAPRNVPIPPILVAQIRNFVGERTSGLVAPNERGGMHDISRLSAAWRKHRLNDAWRPYDLRASITSLHINAGARIAEVAAFMGNSPEVIMRHYLGTTSGDLGRSFEEVEMRLKTSNEVNVSETEENK